MSDDPALGLLGARHVDALTEALHVNARLLTQQAERDARQGIRETRMLALLERVATAAEQVAKYTANLPALMDLLVTKRTNGQGHTHEETRDDRRSDDT